MYHMIMLKKGNIKSINMRRIWTCGRDLRGKKVLIKNSMSTCVEFLGNKIITKVTYVIKSITKNDIWH